MIIVFSILAIVFAHITYKDIVLRLVYRRDLVVLLAFRLVLFGVAVVGSEVFGVSSFGVASLEANLLGSVSFGVVSAGSGLFGVHSLNFDHLLSLDFAQWGVRALVMSVAMALIVTALVQSVAFVANRLTNKYGEKDESLGLGDVKLYAVCCLFLSPEQAFVMLFLSALVGAVMALYVKVIKKNRTFPFAPAIVWSTFAVLVFDVLI